MLVVEASHLDKWQVTPPPVFLKEEFVTQRIQNVACRKVFSWVKLIITPGQPQYET